MLPLLNFHLRIKPFILAIAIKTSRLFPHGQAVAHKIAIKDKTQIIHVATYWFPIALHYFPFIRITVSNLTIAIINCFSMLYCSDFK